MNNIGKQVVKWGPVILKYLPQIIKVGQNIYALWCSIRDNKDQNDTVLKSMKLLNQHQDDIDRLLQDPEQKRALLEGLTILMNRINEHNQREGNFRRDNPPFSFPSPKGATNDDSYFKKSGYSSSSYQDDSMCYSKSKCNGDKTESMSFEEQIECAIALSQREAENHGVSYVEEWWQEVVEAEDEALAMALQESEIYEASQRCADLYSSAIREGSCCDGAKGKESEADECSKCTDDEDCKKEEKDKDKHSALLKEEEDLMVQMAMRLSLQPQ